MGVHHEQVEVRLFTWKDNRWHQARLVKLGDDKRRTITAPASARWSEAHAKLLEVAPEGSATPVAIEIATM
jgi:hypothetical protein